MIISHNQIEYDYSWLHDISLDQLLDFQGFVDKILHRGTSVRMMKKFLNTPLDENIVDVFIEINIMSKKLVFAHPNYKKEILALLDTKIIALATLSQYVQYTLDRKLGSCRTSYNSIYNYNL